MHDRISDRHRGRNAVSTLALSLVLLSCGGATTKQTGQPGGAGGDGGSGGDSGAGGVGTGGQSGGNGGKAGGGAGSGGGAGMGTPDARPSEEEPVDAAGGAGTGGADSGAAGGDGGTGGAGGASGGTGGAPACGMAGQMCCAGNTCKGGAMPSTGAGSGGGMVVLELNASGSDPYKLFADKDLLPIDGPDSGYITDTGTSFKFVLHQNGAEETVSSGAHRQRNELTVNPGNPVMYKGLNGATMSYTWRFHLDTINAHPTWCDIFQIKQHGPLGVAPLLQFRTQGDNLDIALRLTTAKTLPLTAILGQWISASLTVKYGHAGTIALVLKKEDGSELLNYSNNNADMWDTNVDFVRPKWGLYRNQAAGAGEASIQYNNMRIIHGAVGSADSCSCH
jgi:hypothetical protein